MQFIEADNILKKYGLDQEANEQFRIKTLKDTGKMNVGLRLRICADHLSEKARELQNKRKSIVEANKNKCPNYELELQRNPYAHEECSFINMIIPKDFCFKCKFYLEHIREIDISINELRAAAKCFIDEANYDDTWQ